MHKEERYLPLEELRRFEKNFPGVFELYDSMMANNCTNTVNQRDIAYSLAKYYLLKVHHRSEKSLVGNEVWECMYLILTYCEWRKSKQVYTFSNKLYDFISESDGFSIDKTIFDYLPYDTFYIDIAKDELVNGIFVKHLKTQVANMLVFIMLFEKEEFCALTVNLNETTNIQDYFKKVRYISIKEEDAKRILCLAVQACMYLCAKNCDVVENEFQKTIYRPTSSYKNRFSEIRKWDVGFRIAREKEYKNAFSHKENNQNSVRNRPRQHWRKAHWHTYWVGKGHQTKELKFIAPILVNDIDDELPMVEHTGT